MPKTLLIGSGNLDKAAELAELLHGLPWEVRSLRDYPSVPEPIEDGHTFEENAILKARYYSASFGVPCVADDSGLVVDALGGAPGIYSARYAGPDCTYADNNRKLLGALAQVPMHERTARFVCCAAFINGSGFAHTETGTVEGRIAEACRGDKGFGYDPLFLPEGFDVTFGELSGDQKAAISHRGRALRKLKTFLEQLP